MAGSPLCGALDNASCRNKVQHPQCTDIHTIIQTTCKLSNAQQSCVPATALSSYHQSRIIKHQSSIINHQPSIMWKPSWSRLGQIFGSEWSLVQLLGWLRQWYLAKARLSNFSTGHVLLVLEGSVVPPYSVSTTLPAIFCISAYAKMPRKPPIAKIRLFWCFSFCHN